MSESAPIRYQIDFHLIPSLFHRDKYGFSEVFAEEADEFLANVYNHVDVVSKNKVFVDSLKYAAKSHFTVYQKEHPGGIRIIYVTLPPVEDGSHVYCTAYALVLVKGEPNFYTIEESVFGTTCIGTVDREGNHINLGDAGQSVEDNMEILRRYAASVSRNAVAAQRAIYSDENGEVYMASRKLMLYFEGEKEGVPIYIDAVYFCELEPGELSVEGKESDKWLLMLRYWRGLSKWYIIANKERRDIWLDGVRLKPGEEYLIRSGDMVTIQGMTSFTLQTAPGDHLRPKNCINGMLRGLEHDIAKIAKLGRMDSAMSDQIVAKLLHVPLYCWGGIRPNSDTGEMESCIQPIPAHRLPDWRGTSEALNACTNQSGVALQVPVFTSEEEAVLGGTDLGAFLYDYPLPIFRKIIPMGMDVVINPFSQHSVVIPFEVVRLLWEKIVEQNYIEGCPPQNWKRRTIV